MGYIPLIPPTHHHDHHQLNSNDAKEIAAFWIACHLMAIIPMVISYVVAKAKGEWSRYDLPPLFEFFAIWLLAVIGMDVLIGLTYLISQVL